MHPFTLLSVLCADGGTLRRCLCPTCSQKQIELREGLNIAPDMKSYPAQYSFILDLGATQCNNPNNPNDLIVRLPGDIIIGGLFPIHKRIAHLGNSTMPNELRCTGLELSGFVRSLCMIHAIERTNSLNLLPGITLGYEIYDTCADVSKALNEAMRIIGQQNTKEDGINGTCTSVNNTQFIKAVIGACYSEVSIPVSRLFAFQLIPQISYSSTAEILSDKRRFPSFLRTVASDADLSKDLAMLIKKFKWTYVGIISNDDDYGHSILNTLTLYLDSEYVCIAFHEEIPADVGNPSVNEAIREAIDKIKKSPARGIVLVLKEPIVMKFFKEIIKQNITRTWIGTDSWSTSREVTSMDGIDTVGDILGFAFKLGKVPGFRTYLQTLPVKHNTTNFFIDEYRQLRFGCTDEYLKYKECLSVSPNNCTKSDTINFKSPLACSIANISLASDEYLNSKIEQDASYSTYLAVKAIVQALRRMLCSNGICTKNISFAPWELLHELKKVHFSDKYENFFFDENGNANTGFDLLSWHLVNGTLQYNVIGDVRSIQFNSSKIIWNTPYNKVPDSKCSESCVPGQYKIHSDISCCYNCAPCAEGYYSTDYDQSQCAKCPDEQWSQNGSSYCQNRTIEYFHWTDPFAIILTSFAATGVLLVLIIGNVFLKNVTTPAVKTAGGVYTCVMNLSLLASFATTIFFIGEPTDLTCKIRQPLYGISFTLCVSCILIKSFRIVLAFELGERLHYHIKFTYQPVLIIVTLMGVQVTICTLWLGLNGPSVKILDRGPQVHLIQCNEGSYLAYGTMLAYTGLLAFICFVLAYKERKLPNKYNEGRFITFSMLIYLFVWFAFTPIYITTAGVYLPAVELVAIFASNYGVICCHLIPTFYVIFFKKNQNNREEYLQSIRSYSKSDISSSNVDPELPGLENKGCQTCPITESDHCSLSQGLRSRSKSC
ncbi:G-protein coupled receptor family C group 6 member A-like [Pelodytes ibericus]